MRGDIDDLFAGYVKGGGGVWEGRVGVLEKCERISIKRKSVRIYYYIRPELRTNDCGFRSEKGV